MSTESLVVTEFARHFPAAALLPAAAGERSVRVELAESREDLQAAQRLRYTVFAREMGARLHNRIPGLDHDRFDPYCQHLIVRDALDEVVGCTRILTAPAAQRAGGFYSQTEFDLTPILALPGRFMEIGRTCVRADYRNGATINALWSGLAAFITVHQIDYLIGCASIPLGEHGLAVQILYAELARRHLVAESLRVKPYLPLSRSDGPVPPRCAMPPLLKAYLRLGAQIGGEPCLDPDFQVADVFILLPTERIERRYARHFLDRDQ
ncbi:MAG: Hemolysin [Pseudomonadota bacterium]|nr:Hemolysin [Pseudomonadota bacterium]